MRTTTFYNLKDTENFKQQLLQWSQQFKDVVWLDSNCHKDIYSSYDAVLAVDAFTVLKTDYSNAFERLKEYQNSTRDWIFGYLTYDLKNTTEQLKSQNFDGLDFPDLYFFQPKKLFLIKGNEVEIQYLKMVDDEIEDDFKLISAITSCTSTSLSKGCAEKFQNPIKIKLRIHKDEYFEKAHKMLAHIQRGDIYEANFCQEFYAEDSTINPLETFRKLNEISKPPFATFLKIEDKYLLSATPERYIKKEGFKVISQPIKGTAKRSNLKEEDLKLAETLAKDEKERSENIMIVDLVRNDLSQTAIKGSVKVEELCKVYSFLQVHQMISTISSKVEEETHPVEIIKTTFPMGSMTGAPKISAMKIIEDLEETKRGLYSGSVGYFTPIGDFDFNVIIRSILYNETKKYISYSVGSAITAKSDPLKEYEECLIKAKAMREVLEN
ncbi:anthranilate synthase component I family protein [Winogradskyella echinorum]|uniref:Anthranilate synthase component I family protein n=1 Tax=Winogradskyella echinorum TaxID=538189 RepID=A0ABR6Y081_9FLAO|nr:anthranilate synthase component I family protein [Winogradskyella echinorum]MBC3846162.1 anthranilate synthase component I family protein [Winogradskyella echinorum]MBC5750510.1 anthranilate synthase component I family protein [Winogradskyella echinorum]